MLGGQFGTADAIQGGDIACYYDRPKDKGNYNMAGFMRLEVWQEKAICAEEPDDRGNYHLWPESYAEGLKTTGHEKYCGCTETGTLQWWAEYTAPGYLDRTDPVYGDTPTEAARECFNLYGNEESPEERSELAAMLWECRKLGRKGA